MSDRKWIAAEFSKGIDSEREFAVEARARGVSPPDPSLAVLYNQIAQDDERHRGIVEAIATRYGHTPSRSGAGAGIGETLSRLKGKVTELGSSPMQLVAGDLASKAHAIHWTTAWIHAFETIGDSGSARELAAVLTEDSVHRDALQEALNRMVVSGAGATATDG